MPGLCPANQKINRATLVKPASEDQKLSGFLSNRSVDVVGISTSEPSSQPRVRQPSPTPPASARHRTTPPPRQRTPQTGSLRNSTRTGGSSMIRSNGSCSGGRAIPAKRTPVGRIDRSAPREKHCCTACVSIAERSIKMHSPISRSSPTIITRSSRNECEKHGRCRKVP
jgi:hypothetical protein